MFGGVFEDLFERPQRFFLAAFFGHRRRERPARLQVVRVEGQRAVTGFTRLDDLAELQVAHADASVHPRRLRRGLQVLA